MKIKKLSILIPAYNESVTIEKVINEIQRVFAHKTIEVVAVDDGSEDGTWKVLSKLSKHVKNLKISRHKKNMGKGAAIQTGLKKVSGDYVLIQDADLEYEPIDILKLLEVAEKNNAVAVYGSRNLKGNSYKYFLFFLGGIILSKTVNFLYNQNITDESTGYKLIDTNLLKSLDLKERGFGFCPELTSKLGVKDVKIYEVPVSYRPRTFEEGKKITLVDGFYHFFILLREYWIGKFVNFSK